MTLICLFPGRQYATTTFGLLSSEFLVITGRNNGCDEPWGQTQYATTCVSQNNAIGAGGML